MRKSILIISLILFEVFSYSQQQPNLLQLVGNRFIFNPAYAGASGFTTMNMSSHSQWLGTKSSPKTNILSAEGRLWKKYKEVKKCSKIGLGAFFFDERSDLLSKTGFNLTYSYHFFIKSTQLSFGLALTGFQSKLNTKDVYTLVPNDPLLSEDRNQMFIPNSNVGFFIWSPKYYIGFSANQLLQNIIETEIVSSTNYSYKRHYNFNIVYLYSTYDIKIEPSILFKYYENGIMQSDIVLTIDVWETYFFGLGYRTNILNPYSKNSFNDINTGSNGDLLVLMGIHLGRDEFCGSFIGYSIEYPFNEIGKSSYGTHGIMFRLKLGCYPTKYKFIDYY